ncbi:MAG: MBL fold metallo-hydrolase [Thermodesulfobacteriota bacterium]|nr:MBL fold metallo-hydrolase [Thermodesulfobacteriota bacterium]
MAVWNTKMEKLADDVYAYIQAEGTWFVSNAGLIKGTQDAIVIDSLSNKDMVQGFIHEIEKVTDRPVKFLINTHSHGDHIWTNHYFSEAKTICHSKCREKTNEDIQTDPRSYEAVFPGLLLDGAKVTLQDVTFEKRLTLYQDDRKIELIYPGPSHTTGDVFIYLPNERIVFCGDLLFYQCTPLAFMGYIQGWIITLEFLANLEADIYVPGHGPITNKQGVKESQEYLIHITEEAKIHFDAGMSELEAAKDMNLGKFTKWADPERIVLNVKRLYSEFRGEEPAIPLDIADILSEMTQMVKGE